MVGKKKFYRTLIGYSVLWEVEILVQDLNNNKVRKLESFMVLLLLSCQMFCYIMEFLQF